MSSVTPPYVGLTDTPLRQSLATTTSVSGFKQRRSNQIMQNVYEDTLASAVEESWSSTSAWYPTTAARVSGGAAFAPSDSNTQAMTRTGWTVNANQTARMEGVLNAVVGANGTYTLAGFSYDASGVTPASGFTKVAGAIGVYNNNVVFVTQGVVTVLGWGIYPGNLTTSGAYKYTVEVGPSYIFATLTSTGSGQLYVWYNEFNPGYRSTLPAGSILIPWVYLGDSSVLTGSNLGLMSVKLGPASSRKGFGISPLNNFYSYTSTKLTGLSAGLSGQAMVICPPGYDSRAPYPAVLCFHSSGGRVNDYIFSTQKLPITLALLAAGYILILGCSNSASDSSWGNQHALDAYVAAYVYARDNFNIGSLCVLGGSMGSIESLLTLAERRIPDIMASVIFSPAYSQLDCYIEGQAGGFPALMNAAYGTTTDALNAATVAGATSISTTSAYTAGTKLIIDINLIAGSQGEIVTVTANSTGAGPYTTSVTPMLYAHASGAPTSNFPNQLIGNTAVGSPSPNGLTIHDPAQLPASAFRGVPMFLFPATDDTLINQTKNGLALAASMRGISTEILVYPGITGGHTFTPTTDMVEAMVLFLNKYTGTG
jgi:alpha-beta hydrolase superfamily lysophospholipase